MTACMTSDIHMILICAQVPFGLVTTQYRRKRLMEGIMSRDKEVFYMITRMNKQAAQSALVATHSALIATAGPRDGGSSA